MGRESGLLNLHEPPSSIARCSAFLTIILIIRKIFINYPAHSHLLSYFMVKTPILDVILSLLEEIKGMFEN